MCLGRSQLNKAVPEVLFYWNSCYHWKCIYYWNLDLKEDFSSAKITRYNTNSTKELKNTDELRFCCVPLGTGHREDPDLYFSAMWTFQLCITSKRWYTNDGTFTQCVSLPLKIIVLLS